MKLKNKVAIVTGSSRGIGKGIALGFAREGARVVVMARTESADQSKLPGTIHQTIEEVRAAGGEGVAVRCDLTRDDDIEELVKKTLDTYGRIDILVNNAAIILHTGVMDATIKRWDLMVKINVRAPVVLAKLVLPYMVQQRMGSIINISSESARDPSDGLTLYGAADAALERFTTGLALEVKRHNIAVNAMDPGRVKTEGALFTFPPDTDWTGWKEPDDVVPAALFLAAQERAEFTGQVVCADDFGNTWP